MADKCQWALKRNDYKLHTFPFSFLLHIDLKRGLLVMMYVCSYITAHMRGVGNLGLRHTLAKYCRHSSSARLSLHLLHTAFHPLSLLTPLINFDHFNWSSNQQNYKCTAIVEQSRLFWWMRFYILLQISAFFLFSNFRKRQIALYSPCRLVGRSVGRLVDVTINFFNI